MHQSLLESSRCSSAEPWHHLGAKSLLPSLQCLALVSNSHIMLHNHINMQRWQCGAVGAVQVSMTRTHWNPTLLSCMIKHKERMHFIFVYLKLKMNSDSVYVCVCVAVSILNSNARWGGCSIFVACRCLHGSFCSYYHSTHQSVWVTFNSLYQAQWEWRHTHTYTHEYIRV